MKKPNNGLTLQRKTNDGTLLVSVLLCYLEVLLFLDYQPGYSVICKESIINNICVFYPMWAGHIR